MPKEIDPITAEVLHSAVHDLRGPANRLRLLAQLLTQTGGPIDEDTRQLLGHVESSASAVGDVAEGLRNYVEICGRPVSRQTLDLNMALGSALANVQAELASVEGQVNASRLPVVEADPFLMTWLFQELLTNAIRFRAADPPRVQVSSISGGPSNWFVSIADNGPGIEPEMAEKAFRPFKKLSSGGKGAGLGLTMCRRIVESHGGRIWVEPRSDGAELRFLVDGPATVEVA